MRFTGKQDIILLQEVVSMNPFKEAPPTTAWATISKKIERKVAVSSRCCRERTLLLLEQFIKQDFANLHRKCTPQEFALKKDLLRQVQEQYNNGPGGYKTHFKAGPATAPKAPDEAKDHKDPPHVDLIKEALVDPCNSGPVSAAYPNVSLDAGTSSEQEQKSPSSSEGESAPAKRPRLDHSQPSTSFAKHSSGAVTDDAGDQVEPVLDSGGATPADLAGQAISLLQSRLDSEMRLREMDLKLRRKELDVQWAKLELEKGRISLEKAQFELERAERERQLQSENEQHERIMEQFNRFLQS